MPFVTRPSRRTLVSLALAASLWIGAAPAAHACVLIIRTCVTETTLLFGIWEIGDPVMTCTERREPCPS